ncbi:MAG: hypothetical protein ACOYUZ_02055 [Patescibacteria group bacterium]
MRNKYYYLILLPMIAFIAVVAVGFWYTNSQKQKTVADDLVNANGERPYLYPDQEIDINSDEYKKSLLMKAINNLFDAKSFKAEIQQETSGGIITSKVDYVSPLRLRAVVSMGKESPIELIAVGETIYVKSGNEDWKMTNDASLKNFARTFFASMIIESAGLGSLGIADDALMDFSYDNGRECTEVSTKYSNEGNLMDISICVTDEAFIKTIVKHDSEGETKTEYYEYNTLMTIERPMLPLLDPTVRLK